MPLGGGPAVSSHLGVGDPCYQCRNNRPEVACRPGSVPCRAQNGSLTAVRTLVPDVAGQVIAAYGAPMNSSMPSPSIRDSARILGLAPVNILVPRLPRNSRVQFDKSGRGVGVKEAKTGQIQADNAPPDGEPVRQRAAYRRRVRMIQLTD